MSQHDDAPERPPQYLLIYRDVLNPGREADFRAIEEDAARICAELNCPNAHLAIESLTGSKEVWWLTPFESDADRQRVIDGYASNTALTAALAAISRRREGVTVPSGDILTTYRADLSGGAPWQLAGARFVVAGMTRDEPRIDASVFEAADATRFVVQPARTREEAEAIADRAGAVVFAVRPYWGLPKEEWIAADPEFWRVSPKSDSSHSVVGLESDSSRTRDKL
jgi:hypothetical protein